MSELLKELNAVFKRHTGKPITMLSYELDAIAKRLTAIEEALKQSLPVMAATTLKVEAITKCLCDASILQISAIDTAQKNFLIESKKCI